MRDTVETMLPGGWGLGCNGSHDVLDSTRYREHGIHHLYLDKDLESLTETLDLPESCADIHKGNLKILNASFPCLAIT